MAKLVIGIAIFIVVFLLKVIMGAAAGALKGVESATQNDDFGRYTGSYGNHNENVGGSLLSNASGADIIREYRELYEDDIISYEEYEQKKRAILNG